MMKGRMAYWLVEEMTKRDLSVKALASKSGLAISTIYSWRNEDRFKPKVETCNTLAEAFAMHSAKLMADAGLIPPLPEPLVLGLLDDTDRKIMNRVIHLDPQAKRGLADLLDGCSHT
jgi:transcriptional regulator with XRE-family HTH domain